MQVLSSLSLLKKDTEAILDFKLRINDLRLFNLGLIQASGMTKKIRTINYRL